MIKLNAAQLRTTKAKPEEFKKLKKKPIYVILDNVLDTYNIGAIFRLADAVAVEEVIICGQSEIPPNTRIKKASINTTEWVKWRYFPSAAEAITSLKNQISDLKVCAIEQDKKSILYSKNKWEFPLALVVGNESDGVSKEVLKKCDMVVELPMFGVNISLNVMVSLGIVLYQIAQDFVS